MTELKPSTGGELAQALQESADRDRAIALIGADTKKALGGAVHAPEVTVSTTALSRVVQYEPKDLTISVEAGLRWAELTQLLAGHRQMLPLDPPFASGATVGGVVASNSSGPRRRLYGTARDMVIGMTLATLEGRLVQSGGMVVKNVAGLDYQKTMIGSLGTLAAIVNVNFKLAPLPEGSRTFVRSFQVCEEAVEARNTVLRSQLQPAAFDVLNPAAAGQLGMMGFCLLVRAGGSEALLNRYAKELADFEPLEGQREADLWSAVEEFCARQRYVVRVGHPLSALSQVLAAAPQACVSRAGSGVSYLAFEGSEGIKEWMQGVPAHQWQRLVEYSPASTKEMIRLWPDPGPDLAVMQKLKSLFDPKGLLNRGRYYGRI